MVWCSSVDEERVFWMVDRTGPRDGGEGTRVTRRRGSPCFDSRFVLWMLAIG
jgi:hypothetical protein